MANPGNKKIVNKKVANSKKATEGGKTCTRKSKSGGKQQLGGSIVADMTKLTVPFGLVAAKTALERFIKNREKELKKIRSNK